jgi:hypothetical protein
MSEKFFSTFCHGKMNDGFSTSGICIDADRGENLFALSSLAAVAYAGEGRARMDF